MANLVEALERELHAAATERPRDSRRYVAVLERALHAFRTEPTVRDEFDVTDLYLDLLVEYQKLNRYDDALITADAVIDAGIEMRPDPRCLRAETLMRAGRVTEAEPIWAAVLADTPDDAWVYNNAGLEYADAGAHDMALAWLTDGLRLALETGDPERLVDQLSELRQANLERLNRPADALQEHAAAFLRDKQHSRPETSPGPGSARTADTRHHNPTGPVALAWLPGGDYEQAVRLWPELAEGELVAGPAGPLPHELYCRAMQARLVDFSQAGMSRLAVAPVEVASFTAWCAEKGRRPDADARAEYAAHLVATGDPGVVAWPPGRNEPCWCGSARKYKKCCAAPPAVEPEVSR